MPAQKKRTGTDAKLAEPAKKKVHKLNFSDHENKYPGKAAGTKHPRYGDAWPMKPHDEKNKIHPTDALALKGIANDNKFPLINAKNFDFYRSLWEKEGVSTKFYGAKVIATHFSSIKRRYKRNIGAFIIPGMSSKKARDLCLRVQKRDMKKQMTFQQLQYQMMRDEKAWVDPETGEQFGATTKENSARRNEVAETYARENKERIEKQLSIVNKEWLEYCAYTNRPPTTPRKPRKDRKRVPIKDVKSMTTSALSEIRRLKDHEFLLIAVPSKGEIKFSNCFGIKSDGMSEDFANEMIGYGMDHVVHGRENGPTKTVSQLKRDIPKKLRGMGLSAGFDASQYRELLATRGQVVLAEGGLLTWHRQIPSSAPWWKLDKEEMNKFDKHIMKSVHVNAKNEYSGYDLCRHTKHTMAAISQDWDNFVAQQLLFGKDVSKNTKRVQELAAELSQEITKLQQNKTNIKGFRKKDSTIFRLLDADAISDENTIKEVQKQRRRIAKTKAESRQKFNKRFR